MAEPKKKTVTKKTVTKKTTAESKPVTAKKAPAKKIVVSKVDTATIKNTPPTVVAVKKISTKKAPVVKTQKHPDYESSDILENMPKELPVKRKLTDMSLFTTILAISVVTLVVLGGYIYSKQAFMQDKSSPAAETVSPEPQKIRISSAVVLSPAIMSALEDLVTQIAIGPEEVLTRVTSVENIADSQAVDADFYLKAQKGDIVFSFKGTSVLFRPSTKEIIHTGIISV